MMTFTRRDMLRCAGVLFCAAFPLASVSRAEGLADVAVIFVGASWCPHCKQAAPVLAAILEPVGVPVLVASHDGRPILPFARMEDARTHPIAAGIVRLPTTLVYSRVSDSVVAQIEGYGGARRYAGLVSAAVRKAAEMSGQPRTSGWEGASR